MFSTLFGNSRPFVEKTMNEPTHGRDDEDKKRMITLWG
jgi:hypothetical protein